MARSLSVKTERNPSNRDAESRARPFASVLLVAWLLIPAFCLVLRILIGFGGENIKWLIVWLDLLLLGTGLPAAAVAYGYKVAKRVGFVTWHVAVTIHLFAIASSLSVLPGWDAVATDDHWWSATGAWLARVFVIPLWLVIAYYLASLCVALSWLIYRIDAFRASTGEPGGEGDQSGLAALVKWPKGARVRPETVVVDDFAVTAEVSHEGIPIKQIQGSIEALEEHSGVIRGRSSVIGGERGGSSTVRFTHTDPHSEWKVWPGLSHPGGFFHEPLRTSYYSTGETQWYSFVRTPDGYKSSLAPDFASPNGTFKGSQGMTGAGKSGDAAIEIAEILSRRDVQVIYVDTAKLLQNAGWCLDFCSLAAGSRAQSGDLFEGLRRLGEYRAKKLGEANVRDFDDETPAKTGLSWLYLFADEFDVAKQGAAMNWLATKGRSVGIRFSFTLPRATGENMDTNIRGAVGMWAQFGISQDYDKGFVLNGETIDAGANPETFGATTPGVHYLDQAPGIPKRMYAVDCRTYRTRQDYADLRRAVEAARATFTPMWFTAGELKALGAVAKTCRPSVVRTGHLGQDAAPVEASDLAETQEMSPLEALAAAMQAGDVQVSDADRQTLEKAVKNNDKGGPMGALSKLLGDDDDMVLDAATRSLLEDLGDPDVSDIEAEVGRHLDGRTPIELSPEGAPEQALPDVKPPPPTTADAIADFERALIAMHARGVREFGNQDVQNEMRYAWSNPSVSKRFTALTRDASLNPPGITVERLDRGRFAFA